jgi:hypothetical protein
MKTKINLKTQNKKGNEPTYKEDFGYISTFIEGKSNGHISVDAFIGQGESYRRREDAIINVFYGGKLEFSGTLTELINKLK